MYTALGDYLNMLRNIRKQVEGGRQIGFKVMKIAIIDAD
jgi:hypothetical protein